MFAEVPLPEVLISFLIDCSGFCMCCLSCCNLRPTKLLTEAHFEHFQSSIFSTELQLDWMHSSEGLSSAGLLFQSILFPAFYLGVVIAGWSCRLQGVQEHAVKMKMKLFAFFLFSGCIAMFDMRWVDPPPPLFSSFIGCVLSQGSWIHQGY